MANAIDVQMIDTNLYMSKELWLPYNARGAFGGQVIAQALRAAWDTVPEDYFVHSLHCYFILACNVETPVIYHIDRIRDGKSYVTRIVTAKQKGKAIFVSSCSFAAPDKGITLDHQSKMPEVPDPDSLLSEIELLSYADESTSIRGEKFKNRLARKQEYGHPTESREIYKYTPEEVATGNVQAGEYNQRWFRAKGRLNDDLKFHACIIAYSSDSGFINTAARANGYTYNSDGIGMMSSLDHSIWFHQPSRADEWLLYDMHSPRTSGGRGVAFGRIYSRDGRLVATTAQEGVLRLSAEEQEVYKRKISVDPESGNNVISKL
ncbi:Thioesterase/thiol ester dehydrase-isomerase [Backusella circina FSU 941]|nr:Thioesterase/thiol ester dehydrase-isomerase [Backusella circina FSU 941]